MIHYACCTWCGATVQSVSQAEAAEIIADHVLQCEEGPIATVLKILEKYANPYVAERAKEEIRCKVLR